MIELRFGDLATRKLTRSFYLDFWSIRDFVKLFFLVFSVVGYLDLFVKNDLMFDTFSRGTLLHDHEVIFIVQQDLILETNLPLKLFGHFHSLVR